MALTRKFHAWYESLDAKLDEDQRAHFAGLELIQLLAPRSSDAKKQLILRASSDIAAVDLRALEVARAVRLRQQGPDAPPREEVHTAPPAMDLSHCLIPGTLVLSSTSTAIPVESVRADQQLLPLHLDLGGSNCSPALSSLAHFGHLL